MAKSKKKDSSNTSKQEERVDPDRIRRFAESITPKSVTKGDAESPYPRVVKTLDKEKRSWGNLIPA